jgi:isopentenyl-diphosphate delta-isomerase
MQPPPQDDAERPDVELVLVDDEDRPVGTASRALCHDGAGLLHRAFSVHLFDPAGRVLLQRRAPAKRLWAGSWSNACCSHPLSGEDPAAAARRRLVEELDLDAPPEHLFRFVYRARDGERGSEYENCAVYAARTAEPGPEPRPDPAEVDAWEWLAPGEVDRRIAEDPDAFTPWFLLAWPRVRDLVCERG